MKMIHETHEKHEKKTKKICVICVICGFIFSSSKVPPFYPSTLHLFHTSPGEAAAS
jgi:hypothetical protein